MIDDPEARRMLELARQARTPSDADKAAVERRLVAVLGAGLGASAATTSATATAQAAGAKAALGTLGKGALLSKLAWPAGLAGVVIAGYVATIALGPSEGSSTPPAPPAPPASQWAQTVQSAPPSESSILPSAPSVLEPGLANADLADDVLAPSEAPTRAEPSAKPVLRPERPAGAASSGAQDDELDLLHRAQIAWRALEPKRALALLGEHRSRFAGSSLALEREALRAVCLCELGRRTEGARLARSVLDRAQGSPLRATLEQACSLR